MPHYQRITTNIFFANAKTESLSFDSCENRTRFPSILSGAKILIFRKSPKHFCHFLHFREIFAYPFCQETIKTLKMRHLRKSHFSQMICALVYQQVKERLFDSLYHCDFHRFLLKLLYRHPINSPCRTFRLDGVPRIIKRSFLAEGVELGWHKMIFSRRD